MKRLLLCGLVVLVGAMARAQAPVKANYDLAMRWTGRNVSKLVFDTTVTPHWFSTNDRFWYTFETSEGRAYYVVDCRTGTRKPLWDNARMAALLTRITLLPYDAPHLPIRSIKLTHNDTVAQFEIDLSRDSLVRVDDKVLSVGEGIGGDEATKSDDMQDKTKTQQQGKTDTTKTDTVKTDTTTTQTDKKDTTVKTDTTKDVSTGDKKVVAAAKPPAAPPPPTKTLYFEYTLATGKLTLLPKFKAPLKKKTWASVAPDEKTVVFARGHNLFMMDAANYALAQKKSDDKSIKETQLTTDGEEHYSFARTLRDEQKKVYQNQEKDRKDFRVPPVGIVWSKDSRKFAVERDDERKVADLWVINSLAEPRPTLETYRYGMPGEENQPQGELLVFDLPTRTRVKIKADRFADQNLSIESDRVLSREREADKVVDKWLSDSPDKLYFTRESRDRHKVDVCVADTRTGAVTTLIEERLNTYIDTHPLRLVNAGREILFWSERDGWGHYYRYNATGKLLNQVTAGEFTCEGIAGFDEKKQLLYVSVSGHEKGEDPYYTHVYSTPLAGGGAMTLLTPGNSNHAATMSDDAAFCVDTFSRVNTAPHSELRDSSGKLLAPLETADLKPLTGAGFRFPEPFQVKADDGITDLYGVIYKPFDFDPTKHYPVIEYVYPGPQTEAVAKSFGPRNPNIALAQLGFVVVEVGNRGGSPQRSKWYHNFGYGNLRDYGLADKKRAVEELALRYPWIDTDRVGIWGHSGGGFMSAAALMVYPDFFKVAFSESGNHENNIYNRWWSESHHGVKETVGKDGKSTFSYDIDKNSELARNLKGHLMLVTGDMDNNVHPANTIRLANALIRANKRFDIFTFPGQRHGYSDMSDYCFWLRADYFCRNLLGDSQTGADVLPLNRDQPRKGDKTVRRPPTTGSDDEPAADPVDADATPEIDE